MNTLPGERLIKLVDGREVSNYSEEYRFECECRDLLTRKPTRSEKHLYLYGVSDRQKLMEFDRKTGKDVLAADYTTRWVVKNPLMKWRGLAGADKLLAEAKRLHDLTQK